MNKPTEPEHVLAQYLFRACTKLGFCLAPDAKASLLADPGHSSNDFVRRVMLAEGLPPDEYPDHFQSLIELLLATTEGCSVFDDNRPTDQ